MRATELIKIKSWYVEWKEDEVVRGTSLRRWHRTSDKKESPSKGAGMSIFQEEGRSAKAWVWRGGLCRREREDTINEEEDGLRRGKKKAPLLWTVFWQQWQVTGRLFQHHIIGTNLSFRRPLWPPTGEWAVGADQRANPGKASHPHFSAGTFLGPCWAHHPAPLRSL